MSVLEPHHARAINEVLKEMEENGYWSYVALREHFEEVADG